MIFQKNFIALNNKTTFDTKLTEMCIQQKYAKRFNKFL